MAPEVAKAKLGTAAGSEGDSDAESVEEAVIFFRSGGFQAGKLQLGRARPRN